jgi:hypothetical protein
VSGTNRTDPVGKVTLVDDGGAHDTHAMSATHTTTVVTRSTFAPKRACPGAQTERRPGSAFCPIASPGPRKPLLRRSIPPATASTS